MHTGVDGSRVWTPSRSLILPPHVHAAGILRRPLRMPRAGPRAFRGSGPANSGPLPLFGLSFPSNGPASSNIRLVWTGANLLPRTSHTAIWRAKFVQQTGYYSACWHSENNESTWPASRYQYGTHPYPNDSGGGAVDGSGDAVQSGTADDTTHYWEVAGLGANDFLSSPGGSGGVLVVKAVELVQARKCEVVSGTTLRHTFHPDVLGNPTFSIVQEIALSDLNSPSSPAFYFGSSDWAGSDETLSGALWGIALFDAPLSLSDITTEAANDSTNAAVTSAGIASIWYCNKRPTPTDVSDKQTQRTQHSPNGPDSGWANTNRPTLYTG